jgi:hypothetical protein
MKLSVYYNTFCAQTPFGLWSIFAKAPRASLWGLHLAHILQRQFAHALSLILESFSASLIHRDIAPWTIDFGKKLSSIFAHLNTSQIQRHTLSNDEQTQVYLLL